MNATEVLTGIATVVGVAGLGGVMYQVRADHSRRRRQATIEFYAGTLRLRHEFQRDLPYDRDVASVHALVLEAPTEHASTIGTIVHYLSYHEMLAAGVLDGVFDEDLMRRLAESRITRLVEAYAPFIRVRRDRWANPRLYDQLELLARRWDADLSGLASRVTPDGSARQERGGGEEEE